MSKFLKHLKLYTAICEFILSILYFASGQVILGILWAVCAVMMLLMWKNDNFPPAPKPEYIRYEN